MNLQPIIEHAAAINAKASRFIFYYGGGGVGYASTLSALFSILATEAFDAVRVEFFSDGESASRDFTAAELGIGERPPPILTAVDSIAASSIAPALDPEPLNLTTFAAELTALAMAADWKVRAVHGPGDFLDLRPLDGSDNLLSFRRSDFKTMSDSEFDAMVRREMEGVKDGRSPVDTDRPATASGCICCTRDSRNVDGHRPDCPANPDRPVESVDLAAVVVESLNKLANENGYCIRVAPSVAGSGLRFYMVDDPDRIVEKWTPPADWDFDQAIGAAADRLYRLDQMHKAKPADPPFEPYPSLAYGDRNAFPDEHSSGLTRREYFAAAALTGLCSLPDDQGPESVGAAAALAWRIADATIKEGEKRV